MIGTETVTGSVQETENLSGSLTSSGSLNGSVNNSGTLIQAYTLPIASANTLGGIKVGANLTIGEDGTLNATASSEDSGTTDYLLLDNKPSINNVKLEGNKTLADLGIQASGNYANKSDIPTKTSQLTNDSGYITGYTESDPTVPSHVKNISTTDISNWNNKSNFSGSYNDLTNKPTIPTVPTKVSAFTNDAGYLTSIPSEYVTETELNEAISNVGGGTGNVSSDTINSIVVVDELPETEVDGVLYLVKETTTTEPDDGNLFDYTTATVINGYVSTSGATISSYSARRTTYLAIEPSTTYKITKTASSVFAVGTCVDVPVVGVTLNVTEKNSTGSEITITSGASDKYLAIFYTDTSTCSVDETEILQSIVVTKVS